MVQSNDFRRYSYVSDASYALNAFNQTRSSAAPKLRPDTGRGLKVAPNASAKALMSCSRSRKYLSERCFISSA